MTSGLAFALVAVLGTAIGSFLNVVILRTHEDKPWWQGRSHCPHCGTVLRWYDLVPVLSFVTLGGQCRYCHRALTRQYFIVEVFSAIMFVAIFAVTGVSSLTVVGWLVASSMIILAVYDARWSLLPDEFSIVFALSAAILSMMIHRTWVEILIGAGAGAGFFAIQFIASKRRWVGSGDILLGLGLGLLLGWRLLALCFFLAYMSGAIIAAVMILTRRLKASGSLAFGPYLLASGFFSWLWGERLINWYFQHAIFR